MAIVANDTAPAEVPPEAYAKADELRAILHGDLWEEDKIKAIAAFEIGELEMQLAVGLLLTPAERRAWHDYFTVSYGMRIHQK